MSSKCLKTDLIPTAVVLAVALASSSPLWAQAPAARPAYTNDGGRVASLAHLLESAPAADLHLVMMGDMDDMAKMKKMDKMPKKGGMGDKKMKGNMPSDAAMPDPDSSGSALDPMATPSNSDMMGRMRGSMQGRRGMGTMAPMAATASLPGFPGASHLYHVGASGFFLDHPQHITLSTEQQTALNRTKQTALLDRANFDRRIEDAEQELWTLTAADTPDAAKIDAKVRAIETLRGDQRLAFIRAVGEASKVLTADQQAALLGTKPMAGTKPPLAAGKPAPAPAMPAPMKME